MTRFSIYALLFIVILLISSCAGSNETHPSLIESLESFINDIENIPEMENIELIAKNELMRSYVLADSSLYKSQIQALSNHLKNEKAQIEFDPYKNPLDAIYEAYRFRPYTSKLNNDAIVNFNSDSNSSETAKKEFSTALDNSSGVGAFPLCDLVEGYTKCGEYRKATLTTLLIDSKYNAEHKTWISALCKIAESFYNSDNITASEKLYELIELCLSNESEVKSIFLKEKGLKGTLKRFAFGSLVNHKVEDSWIYLAISYIKTSKIEKAIDIADKIKPSPKSLVSAAGLPTLNPAERVYTSAISYLLKEDKLEKAEELQKKIKDSTQASFSINYINKYKIDNRIITLKEDFLNTAEYIKKDDFALYRLVENMYKKGYSEWADQIDRQFVTVDIPDSCSTDEAADNISILKFGKIHSLMNKRLKSSSFHRYRNNLAKIFAEKNMTDELERLIESSGSTIAKVSVMCASAKAYIEADNRTQTSSMLKRINRFLDEIPQNSRGAELLSEIASVYYISGDKDKAKVLVKNAWSYIDDNNSFLIGTTKSNIVRIMASCGMYNTMKRLYIDNPGEIGSVRTPSVLRELLLRKDYAEGLELLKLVDSREFSSLEDYISSKNKNKIEFTREEIADIIDIVDKWKFDFGNKQNISI